MAASDAGQKKRNNYKLLVDPELKKGPKKIYRINGKDVPGFPCSGPLRDPRTQKTVLGGATGSCVDMKIPRFKYDNFWEGPSPERDVFIIGLNEAAGGSALRETCEEAAPLNCIKLHRHPKTKSFLGAATVCFEEWGGGRKALGRLDGKIVGGCYLGAELDDNGEHLKKYLDPVLKNVEKKPRTRPPSQDGLSMASDSDDTRTRNDSISESIISEPEIDSTMQALTPLTPTVVKKDSDPFAVPSSVATKLYPFSSLHMLSASTTPTEVTSSPRTHLNSPFPMTPSSIDSGISLKTHSTILSPDGRRKHSQTFSLPRMPNTPPPPLPPEEQAPPLPPQDSTAPPPLPPLPPATGGSGTIENISSDEEDNKIEALSPVSEIIQKDAFGNPHTFDPSLGLKSLLARKMDGSNITQSPSGGFTSNYEIEVEEISGDESPVMVYFEPLEVETISDDEIEGGGDDMEVCSDDESSNVIELNVKASIFPAQEPLLPPPRMMFPPPAFFLDPFPPHLPFLPPPSHRHHPHIPLIGPPFRSQPPPRPFLDDHTPLANGYSRRRTNFAPSRLLSKAKLFRSLPSPRNKKDGISQDVLFKALEQLRMIVLNDVQKKIVESSAYPVLDTHWEKRQKEKQALSDKTTLESTTDKEKTSQPLQPYRRMLPGMKVKTDSDREPKEVGGDKDDLEEEEEEPSLPTPRKRLMNFKIPLVRGVGQRRDQSASTVIRRRLFGGKEEPQSKSQKGLPPSKTYDECSDISSSEDFSSGSEDDSDRSSDAASWNSDRDSSTEPQASQHITDREKEYRAIFGDSSDSDNFEDFVAQNKSKKRRHPSGNHSDESIEDTAPPKKKRAGSKLKAKSLKTRKKQQRKGHDFETDEHIHGQPTTLDKENLERIDRVIKQVHPPKPKYKKRAEIAEEEIVVEYLSSGPGKEDVQMFKLALARLLGEGEELVTGVRWAHYPDTPRPLKREPPTKRRRGTVSGEPADHVTGCARSEGYYKITMREKVKYLPHHRLKNTTQRSSDVKSKSSGRVNRANQRKLASLFSAGDVSSDLAKYNQLKARKKQLKFAKSTIHNWGLFAMESIAADEMIIEYVGQMVRQAVADEREKRYEAAGIGSSYLFRVDHDYIIDATRQGNLARFINHCCDPNCYAKVITVGALKKIVIYSKRDIALGEEITYDYKFPIEDEKIQCLCGAPMCRGTLN